MFEVQVQDNLASVKPPVMAFSDPLSIGIRWHPLVMVHFVMVTVIVLSACSVCSRNSLSCQCILHYELCMFVIVGITVFSSP